jgi:hypothetical protein
MDRAIRKICILLASALAFVGISTSSVNASIANNYGDDSQIKLKQIKSSDPLYLYHAEELSFENNTLISWHYSHQSHSSHYSHQSHSSHYSSRY